MTWYWVGFDTVHSVTRTSANDAGVDTDPGTNLPRHDVGDSFQHSFEAPGTYTFHCKLHPAVAGTVVVSANPGDPNTEVDPVPHSNVDLKPPSLSGLRLRRTAFPRHGTTLHFALNEAASLDAEYYRLPEPGARGSSAHRRFAGCGSGRAATSATTTSRRHPRAPFRSQSGALRGDPAGDRRRPQHGPRAAARVHDPLTPG